MKALILAAGRGSRLGDLTADRPKGLVELLGRPLLHWQCAALTAAGVSEIGLVRGYLPDTWEGRGLRLFDNLRWAETNMVSSLDAARKWVQDDETIVSYSDIFYSRETVERLIRSNADLAIAYDPDAVALWSQRTQDPLSDLETFALNEKNELTDIGRKPTHLSEVQGQYMGLLKFRPEGWRRWFQNLDAHPSQVRDRMDMTTALRLLLPEPIAAVPCEGLWGEVDCETDLRLYEGMILSPEGTSAPAPTQQKAR